MHGRTLEHWLSTRVSRNPAGLSSGLRHELLSDSLLNAERDTAQQYRWLADLGDVTVVTPVAGRGTAQPPHLTAEHTIFAISTPYPTLRRDAP